jgi:DNA-binding response OmpR family regulator
MLPGGMEGLDVLGTLREAGSTTPVLILSALSTVDERVKGLRAGGDDYLVKPFEYIELTARLDSLVRRSQTASQEQAYRVGALNVDLVSRSVVYAGKEVELLPREYRILEYMIRREGQVISRTMLFEAVWNYRVGERTNVIDVHISRLRRKLDPTGSAPIIHTVRGSGYVLRAPD